MMSANSKPGAQKQTRTTTGAGPVILSGDNDKTPPPDEGCGC